MADGNNVWTVKLIRELSTVIMGETDKDVVKEIARKDAISQGIITQEDLDGDEWRIEVSEGAALQWREDVA